LGVDETGIPLAGDCVPPFGVFTAFSSALLPPFVCFTVGTLDDDWWSVVDKAENFSDNELDDIFRRIGKLVGLVLTGE